MALTAVAFIVCRQLVRWDATFDIQKGTFASVGKRRVRLSSCVITVTGDCNLSMDACECMQVDC
jgi:hypothetical protein